MQNTYIKFKVLLLVIISLSFGILMPSATAYSQNHLRIFEDIGGGSGSETQTDDSNNSVVFIVGGLVVVGVVAYFLLSRDKKKDEEEAESSSVLKTLKTPDFSSEFNDFEHEVAKAKDNIPIDFMIEIRNSKAFTSDKTYLMGIAIRF